MDNADRIKIEGPPDEVDKAREALEEQVTCTFKVYEKKVFQSRKSLHLLIVGRSSSKQWSDRQQNGARANNPDS